MKEVWASEAPTVEHLMNIMLDLRPRSHRDQATQFMRDRKQSDRSWMEQYQYSVYVACSASCSNRFVLQYICEGDAPDVRQAMQTRLFHRRTYYLKQAYGLANFVSTFEQDVSGHVVSGGRHFTYGKSYTRYGNVAFNAIVPGDGRRFRGCNQLGHTKI